MNSSGYNNPFPNIAPHHHQHHHQNFLNDANNDDETDCIITHTIQRRPVASTGQFTSQAYHVTSPTKINPVVTITTTNPSTVPELRIEGSGTPKSSRQRQSRSRTPILAARPIAPSEKSVTYQTGLIAPPSLSNRNSINREPILARQRPEVIPRVHTVLSPLPAPQMKAEFYQETVTKRLKSSSKQKLF